MKDDFHATRLSRRLSRRQSGKWGDGGRLRNFRSPISVITKQWLWFVIPITRECEVHSQATETLRETSFRPKIQSVKFALVLLKVIFKSICRPSDDFMSYFIILFLRSSSLRNVTCPILIAYVGVGRN